MPPSEPGLHDETSDEATIAISIKFSPVGFSDVVTFPQSATLDDLIVKCEDLWPEYEWGLCKMMVETRPRRPGVKGLLKAQGDGDLELSRLEGNTLKLLAQRRSDIQNLHAASTAAGEQRARRAAVLARARARTGGGGRQGHRSSGGGPRNQAEAQYTFHTIRPLAYLPRPERSREFLERLKADPGIRAAMRKHKFSVGLLTEMDPAAHTQESHEGVARTLGLNRNRGEVVELRLRTDAYDGYRDYKTIRKTLCHELAHNVHGPHDRNFWDLCHQIEREVAAADWKSGGQSVGQGEFAPERGGEEEEEEAMDHGGWIGGEYVLGGGTDRSGGGSEPMNRREILARAAEERIRNIQQVNQSNTKDDNKSTRGQ